VTAAAEKGRRRRKSSSKPRAFVQRVTVLLTSKDKRRRSACRSETVVAFAPEGSTYTEEHEPLVWPPERIALTDRLWGEGFTTPGGAEYVIDFIQLLDLSEKKSLLNVGAGLGGPTRSIKGV
jgi:hypothetical protein